MSSKTLIMYYRTGSATQSEVDGGQDLELHVGGTHLFVHAAIQDVLMGRGEILHIDQDVAWLFVGFLWPTICLP